MQPSTSIDIAIDPTLIIEPTIESTFNMLQQGLTGMKTQIATLQQQLRTLEKSVKNAKKEEQKEMKRTQSTSAAAQSTSTAAPSTATPTAVTSVRAGSGAAAPKQKKITGFCIAEPLSADLCEFMKLPPNSTSARIAVSTAILNYIRSNKLQDPAERKNIKADATLRALFKLRDYEELTYFNIQTYISKLFRS
jgi:chromatin remodeling complex protein RSC6